MSNKYDAYLKEHTSNVVKGLKWFMENLPEFVPDALKKDILTNQFQHDSSKYTDEEYNPYDAYFYGNNKSFKVVQDFNAAWLHHIHKNAHHWQHWVLINDEPKEGEICIEMPDCFVIEMICDWWAFSWKKGDLFEIFNWWDAHKDYIKLHKNTRKKVEDVLGRLRMKLEDA